MTPQNFAPKMKSKGSVSSLLEPYLQPIPKQLYIPNWEYSFFPDNPTNKEMLTEEPSPSKPENRICSSWIWDADESDDLFGFYSQVISQLNDIQSIKMKQITDDVSFTLQKKVLVWFFRENCQIWSFKKRLANIRERWCKETGNLILDWNIVQ